MATVYWDARRIIYTDYLEKGQTISGAYYVLLLPWLSEKKEWCNENSNYYNIHRIWPPSDFFKFPNLKKWLGGQRYTLNKQVIAQTDAYFEDIPKSYFLDDLKKVEKHLEYC